MLRQANANDVSTCEVIARLYRGSSVESVHYGIALTDRRWRITVKVADPAVRCQIEAEEVHKPLDSREIVLVSFKMRPNGGGLSSYLRLTGGISGDDDDVVSFSLEKRR